MNVMPSSSQARETGGIQARTTARAEAFGTFVSFVRSIMARASGDDVLAAAEPVAAELVPHHCTIVGSQVDLGESPADGRMFG
jgi:hypothetical protein